MPLLNIKPTTNTEYIKVKVFLYKYTPKFNLVDNKTNKNATEARRINDEIIAKQKELDKNKNFLSKHALGSLLDTSKDKFLKQWNSVINPYWFGTSTVIIGGNSYIVGDYQTFIKNGDSGKTIFDDIIINKTQVSKNIIGGNEMAVLWNNAIVWYLNNRLDNASAIDDLIQSTSKLFKLENKSITGSPARQRMWSDTYQFMKTVRSSLGITQTLTTQKTIAAQEAEIATLKKELYTFSQGLSRIQRFSVELNENTYFSKVDISDFVIDYRFNQSIHNEINWVINLYNSTLDETKMSKYFLKTGFNLSEFTEPYSALVDYETEDDNFTGEYDDNADIIKQAMINRANNVTIGVTQQASDQEKGQDLTDRNPQFLLSNLIQKFDFVSCYIYKSKEPIDETLIDLTTSGSAFKSAGLNEEAWLEQNGFSNEFNGFVLSKTMTRAIGSMNTLSIAGAGAFCLLDRTKVLYSPTLFTQTLYDQAEVFDRNQLTVFSSLFTDKSISNIIGILLRDIYRIADTFQDPTKKLEILSNLALNTKTSYYNTQLAIAKTVAESNAKEQQVRANSNLQFTADQRAMKLAELKASTIPASQASIKYGINFNIYDQNAYKEFLAKMKTINLSVFFDLARLKVENGMGTNVFTLAPFLYATVMKQRGAFYRDATQSQVSTAVSSINNSINTGPKDADGNPTTTIGSAISLYMANNFSTDNITFAGGSSFAPVLMDLNVNELYAFFQFIESGFSNFTPVLMTPNQILDQVKAASFIEIFETTGGVLVIRNPKYNDSSTMIFSSNYNIVSTRYTDQINGLTSKQKLTWQTDLIKNIPFNVFAFTNGKLLLQYGLTEAEASPNPNAKFSLTNTPEELTQTSKGIFNYARFYLELNNAAQKTSSIGLEYIPAVTTAPDKYGTPTPQYFGVGNLFFDETNSKVSYIIGVEKSCAVGGALNMSLTGAYVRDAYNVLGTVSFRQLPELVDLNEFFKKKTVSGTTFSGPAPTVTSLVPSEGTTAI